MTLVILRRIFSMAALWTAASGVFLSVNALPSGFIAEVVTSRNAVTGTFAPNPRNNQKPMLMLVDKEGSVSVLEDPDNSPEGIEILNLDGEMCTDTERGLQTLAVHPNFGIENHYIYLYYNKFRQDCLADKSDGGPWNVVDRFEMDPDTLLLNFDNRKEIWRGAPLPDSVHNGGALVFGNDGKLYITVGDGGEPNNAQDMRTMFGSLVRLNDDGSIPDDNPFTSANGYEAYPCAQTEGKLPDYATENGVCAEVFAYGLRNPFRMTLDPNEPTKTRMAISDVGGKVWEELNYAGTDYAGVNYGYKTYEGPCMRHTTDDCPVSDKFTDPFYFYQHHAENDGCVAGSVFVPEHLWPEEYKFLFIDFVFYEIYTLIEEPEQECRSCIPPVPRFRNETFYESTRYPGEGKNEARMLDLFFGPYEDTQALYVIKFGNRDTVLRIRYTGINNSPPVVDFTFDVRNYDIGEAVQFDGSLSSDAEGDELTFNWYFGDGEQSSEVSPTHTYQSPGEYVVTLIVMDSLDQAQQKSASLVVGDPPTVSILSPSYGDRFSVGQVFQVQGEAFHANGNQFNDMELEWEVRKHHDDHYHPFLDPTNGNLLELPPAPEPEDLYAALNSYLEIILRVTDKDGLTAESSVLVQPSLVKVEVDTYPTGLKILVDEEPLPTLQEVWSWTEHDLHLKVENQPPYVFTSWSDGVISAERTVTLNTTNLSFVANFCVQDGGSCELQRCCNATCNTNGKCGEGSEWDFLPATTSPEETDESAPSEVVSSNPEIFDISNPPLNVEHDSDTSGTLTMSEPRNGISAAGEAMLIIVVLLSVAGIGLSLLYKRYRQQGQQSIRRFASRGSKSRFLDVEKLSTDDGEIFSEDGTILQTPSS